MLMLNLINFKSHSRCLKHSKDSLNNTDVLCMSTFFYSLKIMKKIEEQ